MKTVTLELTPEELELLNDGLEVLLAQANYSDWAPTFQRDEDREEETKRVALALSEKVSRTLADSWFKE